jgi:hypothetical protein
VNLLGSAAALRWSRPDLAGAIADHVRETSDADVDPARWLRAAGWAVSARSATGDGRPVASEVLDGVVRRGAHVLDEPAADRLRVELALLATAAGRLATARTLLTPVSVAETVPEMRADALGALARCAVEDRPTAVDGLLRRVESIWTEVGGSRGAIGVAAACLVAAMAERRAGRPAAAVEKATEGLARLESSRGGRAQSPSRHLAAGLAAEWLSGLLDAGREDEAREGCVPLEGRLRDTVRPSRQMALLRLAVARTATASGPGTVIAALTEAARDAAASDAPDLEAVCLSTLGALQEKAGQSEQGRESVRLAADARRRDEHRAERFRTALDAAVILGTADVSVRTATDSGGARVSGHRRPEASAGATSPPTSWTDWGTAVARDRTTAGSASSGASTGSTHLTGDSGHASTEPFGTCEAADGTRTGNGRRSSRNGASGNGASSVGASGNGRSGIGTGGDSTRGDSTRGDSTAGQRAVSAGPDRTGDVTATDPHGISPWQGWTDDSPIGHLLAQSLRPGVAPGTTAHDPPPTVERPPSGRPAGRREERRYPDAVADPWSTGSWSTGHWARRNEAAGRRAAVGDGAGDPPVTTSGRAGRRRRGETVGTHEPPPEHRAASPEEPSVPDGPYRWYGRYEQATSGRAPSDTGTDSAAADQVEAAAEVAVDPGSGSWLQNALAELDRAWGAAGGQTHPGPKSPEKSVPEPAPGAGGCVVVIDLARDGRRFAGRRAGSVVRALADRLGDRLPAGARVRHDDGDALSVVLPGWDRSPATGWMHSTLPGLFEDFVPDEDMPGIQLRAAVHDTDGPAGAQLLCRLDRSRRRHATGDALGAGPLWRSLPSEPVAAPAAGGRRHRRGPDEPAEHPAATGQDVVPDVPPVGGQGGRPDSTDGLGLADLLAGALAAYRGI